MTVELLTGFWLAVLSAAVFSFAAAAWLQSQRSHRLARRANEMGLAYSGEDLFDAPHRYAALALMRAGHSCRAHNVIYGRREGLPIRAFDFHYEVGHGTTRAARRYWALVVETEHPLCELILWNRLDRDLAPLDARLAESSLEHWAFRGSGADAQSVAAVLRALAGQGVSLQSSGRLLMLCLPAHRRMLAEASQFEIAAACARLLSERV